MLPAYNTTRTCPALYPNTILPLKFPTISNNRSQHTNADDGFQFVLPVPGHTQVCGTSQM